MSKSVEVTLEAISHYQVFFMGYNTQSHDAKIALYNKLKRVGSLYFYRDGKDIPADEMTLNGAALHFNMDKFRNAHHLLQSEKPMYLRWDPNDGVGYIQTSVEPTGEEEGKYK